MKRSRRTVSDFTNLSQQSPPVTSDTDPEAMADNQSRNPQITTNIQPLNPAAASWNPAQVNADAMYDYCSVAVTDPRLSTNDRLKIYQAMQLSRAAQQQNVINNAFVNSQLAAAAGTGLYGHQYGRWIEAAYQGSQLGLPPPPPPSMHFQSSKSKSRPRGRGRRK